MKSTHERYWLLPAVVVLASVCFFLIGVGLEPINEADAIGYDRRTGERLIAVPVQIARDSFGLAMVDTAGQTLWVYQFNNRGPAQNRLKLLAARSWKYDRLLEELNTAEPSPKQVKLLLENLGRQIQPEKQITDSDVSGPKTVKTDESNSVE